ncbi:MAG TPA: PIG-L family deacetylase [Candidatus Saccharimonadales bacterium]|nr:PIG-L family deacetylase [Candidatus Saccharimonadales bacterium]
MKRRDFVGDFLVGGVLLSSGGSAAGQATGAPPQGARPATTEEVFVERPASGKPHAGKVLAAIQPHTDDIPIFAGGTVAKLIGEGYKGYLIRTTNDEMAGSGTTGNRVLDNERDTEAVAKALGLEKVFNLEYRNHQMDEISRVELRARLIHLIRLLKIDTIVCYDPWGIYEENPDHYVTAQVVEASCWMAGLDLDYPEQLAGGLQPHAVQEKYYFARGPQIVNRVVDISPWIDRKVEANVANKTQGPGGENGARLRAKLASQKLRLPVLGGDDDTANRAYIKNIVLDYDSLYQRGVPSDKGLGQKYGLEWAEAFHYIGPRPSQLERYTSDHAVPL